MKQFLFILIILSIIGCKSSTQLQSASYKSVLIQSNGEVTAVPDMASFQVNLSCLDKSIERSKQCLVEKSNALNKQLKDFGIDQKDIITNSVNLNKTYIWNSGTRTFEGYRSSSQLYVTVRAIDELDEIYTALLGNEYLELAGLAYRHSKMDSLQNEAYSLALKKSEATVDRLLLELPESKREIMNIGNVQFSSNPIEYKANSADLRMSEEGNQSISISPGTIKVNATLLVEFKIK